jgi:hypothetical protein
MNSPTTVIVYIDDAQHAQRQLADLLALPVPTRWVLVACAPRMTRRIGKWLSHASRENWRDKWCDKLFAQMRFILRNPDASVDYVVANSALPELTEQLHKKYGAAQLIDARRPKFDTAPAVTAPQPGWPVSSVLGSLAALTLLSFE